MNRMTQMSQMITRSMMNAEKILMVDGIRDDNSTIIMDPMKHGTISIHQSIIKSAMMIMRIVGSREKNAISIMEPMVYGSA